MSRDEIARQAYANAWADGASHEAALTAAVDAVYAYDLARIANWLRDRSEQHKTYHGRAALVRAAEKLERRQI